MSLLLRLGYRNLWRNRRRTLLTMTAMGLSTALLVLFLGIEDGLLRDAIRNATGVYFGDAKVTAPGYLGQRQSELTLPETAISALQQDPAVNGAAGRVRGFALLSVDVPEGGQSQPAELLGVVPEEEKAVSQLADHVIAGQALSGIGSKDMVMGQTLAKRLGVKVGSNVIAMGQGMDGSVAAEIYHVVGILGTGDVMQDTSLALVGRKTLQEMLGLDGRIHEWTVSLKSPMDAKAWAKQTQPKLKETDVTGWERMLPQMASLLDMWWVSEFVIGVVFYFAVILVSINTITMALMERLREFAVMGALGLKPLKLWQLMMLEGGMMSAIAGLVGGTIGALLSFYIQAHPIDISQSMSSMSFSGVTMQPVIRTFPNLVNILGPMGTMMLLGVGITAVPAWKLSRKRPVDALREV